MAETFCQQHRVARYIKWQATGRALEKAREKLDNSFTLKAFFGANAWISLNISSSEFMSLLKCELKAVQCPYQPNPVEAVIQERGEYLYDVIYKPHCKGRYELHLSFTGAPILDSPYSILVTYQNDRLENRLAEIGGVKSPWGAAFTQKGSLVVSERAETGCVAAFWLNGNRQGSSTAPQQAILNPGNPLPKAVAADLDLPCGIAVANRNILVADQNGHCIKIYNRDTLHYTKKVGTKGAGSILKFTFPTGIAYNSKNGKIYVTDFYHCVQVFHSGDSFAYSHTFGKKGSGEGQLLQPWDIACDVNGKVYIADSGNERIQIFTEEGKFLNSIDMTYQYPLAVAVGPCGEIYVACPSMSRKESTAAKGSYHTQTYRNEASSHITVFHREGEKYVNYYSMREFVYPCGLAVDESGVLCVCDGGTNSLVLF